MATKKTVAELIMEYKLRPANPISEQRQKWVKLGRDILTSEGQKETELDKEIDQLYIMGQITRLEMDELMRLSQKN
jgi:hypothetical protein